MANSKPKTGKIVLVRHAYAGKPDPKKYPDDTARPLTAKGIQKFKKAAPGLGQLVKPDFVISSQFARCLQTAGILEWDADWPAAVAYDVLDNPYTPPDVVKDIKALDVWPCTVALVGHGPNLAKLLEYLVPSPDPDVPAKMSMIPDAFSKGGAALVSVRKSIKPHTGELDWYRTRKSLKQ